MASQTTSSFVVDKEKVVIVRHKTLLLGSLDEENNLKPNYCTLKDNNLEKALMAGSEHLETLVKKEDLMVNLERADSKFANHLVGSTFRDSFLTHLRLYVKKDGKFMPTTKGQAYTLPQLESLLKVLPNAYLSSLELSSDDYNLVQNVVRQATVWLNVFTEVEDLVTIIDKTLEKVQGKKEEAQYTSVMRLMLLSYLLVIKLDQEKKLLKQEEGEKEKPFDCSYEFFQAR